MPIRELLRALERSAAAEREELLAGARQTAERIRAAADRDRTAQLEAELERHREHQRALAEARLAGAERDERRRLLLAKERLLRRLRDRLDAALPELARAASHGAVEQLVAAAVACTSGGDLSLRCAPELADRARRAAGAIPVVRDDAIATGVVLATSDGRVVVESTLASLLERWWPRLRIAALAIANEANDLQSGGT